MTKKSDLLKSIEALQKEVFDLRRRVSSMDKEITSVRLNNSFSFKEARLQNLEAAIAGLIKLEYPEATEQEKKFVGWSNPE
jgi:uncharacterized protein YlxW (UPF0749 family)